MVLILLLFLCIGQINASTSFGSQSSGVTVNGGSFVFQLAPSSWQGSLEVRRGTVDGPAVPFSYGSYIFGGASGFFDSIFFDPSTTISSVLFAGNGTLYAQPGLTLPFVSVGGTNNVLRGQPDFSFTTSLRTAAAALSLGIDSVLNRSIALNGGTIQLLTPLTLADGTSLTGSGSILFNNERFSLPSNLTTWAGNLALFDARDIQLNGKTILNGVWTFTGPTLQATINGQGNILDLSGGGRLFVSAGTTLNLTNIQINGIGSSSIILEDALSTLRLSGAALTFATTYTFTQGGVYVEGEDCTFIVLNNTTLTFDQNGTLTVDGVTLFYDTLSFFPKNNLYPQSPDTLHLVYLNNGTIQPVLPKEVLDVVYAINTIDHGPSHLHFTSASITLSQDLFLSDNHRLYIHANTVINGAGHTIFFSNPPSAFSILLDPGVTPTFQDVVIRNYADEYVSYGAGSLITFGNNCCLYLGKEQELSRPFIFAGQSLFDGQQYKVTLGNDLSEYIAVLQGSTLTIQNMQLAGLAGNNLRCVGDTARLCLRQMMAHLEQDYSLTAGAFVFGADVHLTGTFVFSLQSSEQTIIDADSRLILDTSLTLEYDPPVALKDRLAFTDSTAQLVLNGCTVVATTTCPQFTRGVIVVENDNYIVTQGTNFAEAVVFGNALNPPEDIQIILYPNATLEFPSGYVDYQCSE